MQALLIFAAGGIILIGVQTSLVAVLPPWLPFYNLLIPYVIFLTLFRPVFETLPQIIMASFFMDMISGAPLAAYTITFIVLFVLFRNIKTYFQLLDSYLFVILIAVGVVIEHAVFGIALLFENFSAEPSLFSAYVIFIHCIWAIITGPLLFHLFSRAFAGIDAFRTRRSGMLG